MMDGYALRSADMDNSGLFEIVAQAPAGVPQQKLGQTPRGCAEIMTGAVVPGDADCVVPYESTRRIDDKHMQLLDPMDHAAGDFIHKFASDRPAGETLLEVGTHIGTREIAVAATCGYTTLSVSKKPTIAIVSTGDELVEISAKPLPHQIRRSNDIMIDAALKRLDLPACQFADLPDEAEASQAQLAELIAANDFVILSGGISMGKKDFIPTTLDALGLKCHFHGVAQKPGKPLGFWSNESCAVFALPGNPLSTLTCLHHYIIPALQIASAGIERRHSTITLSEPYKGHPKLTVFLPVSLGPNNQARAQPAHNSGDMVSILKSDGYIELPAFDQVDSIGNEFIFHPWL
jgi:molybdopterin molybdotransferase